MTPTAVIDVVGLTPSLLGADTPYLAALARNGVCVPLDTVTPAVTCTAQSSMLTGGWPRDHGVVANGWYFRDLAQIWLWRQANQLVGGEKVWDTARRRDPDCTCANLFWWFNMYSSADYAVTPRPIYPADGRKIPGTYSAPAELGERLTAEIGPFPFFSFWGPTAGLPSSEWIAEAALKVEAWHQPGLLLVYLPHLDYNLQRLGPDHPDVRRDLHEIDRVCARLIDGLRAAGKRVIVLSEYGITPVTGPIHVNRRLREAGLLRVREELGLEMLDAGASDAVAMADHQIAHVYVNAPERLAEVRALLEATPGIEAVLDRPAQADIGLDHPRSGELVAIAAADRWFTYYYWLDDEVAPDFARTVDIHRKPGYDPAELFLDPALRLPRLRVAWTLARKRLGFRYLMRTIPLDASLVRGSHGRLTDDPGAGPLLISTEPALVDRDRMHVTGVKDLILAHLFD